MSGTTSKYIQKSVAVILFVMTGLSVSGQNVIRSRSLKLTLGGGYGYFFNTFANVLDEDVKNYRPSFYGKLMWVPEYRLRIGFESGYYGIYSTSRIETGSNSQILTTNLNVIPLFVSFAMKITKHFDLNFATGGAIMSYRVIINKSKKNRVDGQSLSLSDFTTGFTLYQPLGKRFELGAEFKYLYLGKTRDIQVSAFLNLSYKIVDRPIK